MGHAGWWISSEGKKCRGIGEHFFFLDAFLEGEKPLVCRRTSSIGKPCELVEEKKGKPSYFPYDLTGVIRTWEHSELLMWGLARKPSKIRGKRDWVLSGLLFNRKRGASSVGRGGDENILDSRGQK